jgi:hypothetical protein
MKKFLFIGFILFVAFPAYAENYLLNGGQASRIDYKMEQEVVPFPGIRKLILSYVVPQTFRSPSYNQEIKKFDVTFSVDPHIKERVLDLRGNLLIKAIWEKPKKPIHATIEIETVNKTNLKPLQPKASFPLKDLPAVVRVYLASTKQVPAEHPQIVTRARQLTSSATTQFDAVQQILSWIVDRMTYVQRPRSYDALYSLRTGRGNCQNYSHLAATLMRSVGIPVRIVNGVTLKQPYHVKIKGGTLTMRMAQGRHSWIEVYFPDLGWVPFDPQQTQLFVSNRFIRVEIGLDNHETVGDGTVRWTQSRRKSGMPTYREAIAATFISDDVDLVAEKQAYGPRKMLFTPPVEASFSQLAFEQNAIPGDIAIPEDIQDLTYDEPTVFGNLDFPQNVDFLDISGPVEETEDSVMVMHKSFLVETSEYVTTKGLKYAQTIIVEDPMKLHKVGLAIHKFGGNGQVWVELREDDGSGRPGEYLASSEFLPLDAIKFTVGYDWVDFDFSKNDMILPAGRYWIALGYTGSPVINWFFTYGKPVGPDDGTRYNTMFDETWSHSLAYEFNYRIEGMRGR